ncbi:MAG: hypothetical protein QOG33_1734 [Gaiellales bacterium]|nr:hypothetical protein [Gaiellales bacterium]
MEGFKDLGNPTPVELTSWAFSDQKTWIQDWHIIVTRPNLADTLLVLGANPRCPEQEFFLTCLYLLVGDAVWSRYKTSTAEEINSLLLRARGIPNEWIETWIERSAQLIENPSTFEYEDWCHGGLARKSHAAD